MIALSHYGLHPQQVIEELARRAGTSGIEEKALRKAIARETAEVQVETPRNTPQ
jgi:phosphoribosyl-ATP pyrophosphohydrolase